MLALTTKTLADATFYAASAIRFRSGSRGAEHEHIRCRPYT
jgi:hypothetical protein